MSLTRRRFGVLLAAAAGAVGLPGGMGTTIRAQDAATPAAGEFGAYPELKLVSTDTALMLPAQIPAGRYLVTIENQSTHGESAPAIFPLPDERTAEELIAEPVNPETGLPGWIATTTFVGAPIAPLGTTAQAIVDLAPGRYGVWGEPYQPIVELAVVAGSSASPAEPEPEAEIAMTDTAITGLPERVAAGKHLWAVAATGTGPHRFQLYSYPEPITLDQLMAAFAVPEGTPPPAGVPDLSLAVQLGGLGLLSTGRTAWPVVDLAPGTYIAICMLGLAPHYLAGEVAIFTVEDGPTSGATPTA